MKLSICKNSILLFFLIVFFNNKNSHSQGHVSSIPTKYKFLTITNWLVASPIENNTISNKIGYKEDFLVDIGGETSPIIVQDKKFKTPDGKYNTFKFQSWKTGYIDLTDLYGKPTDFN